jgi:lipopolysaccharide export LptBFGC system permease protein LptF
MEKYGIIDIKYHIMRIIRKLEMQMVTVIYSLGEVNGAEIWASGFFVCILVFAVACMQFKANRTKNGIITILLSLLMAETICDISWFLIYYSGGSYHNYGIGGVYGVLLWPAILLLAGAISTKRNISRSAAK